MILVNELTLNTAFALIIAIVSVAIEIKNIKKARRLFLRNEITLANLAKYATLLFSVLVLNKIFSQALYDIESSTLNTIPLIWKLLMTPDKWSIIGWTGVCILILFNVFAHSMIKLHVKYLTELYPTRPI